MKNLHKAMLSIASVAISLSSSAFAMDSDKPDILCTHTRGETSSSAPSTHSVSTHYEMQQIRKDETYENWLERRLDAFASSPLFSALPDDRGPLLNLSLREHIASWQQNPKLFYNPLMEADPRMKEVKSFNAELAILWFEKDTIARLVRRESGEISAVIDTETNYAFRSLSVKRAGQRIVSAIVEDLRETQAQEMQKKKRYFKRLKQRWRADLDQQASSQGKGLVWGLPARLETGTDLSVLGIAEHYCTAQLHQNKAWREDLRMNDLFNLHLDYSNPNRCANELPVKIYNKLAQEQYLEERHAREKAAQEEREKASRERKEAASGKKGARSAAASQVSQDISPKGSSYSPMDRKPD